MQIREFQKMIEAQYFERDSKRGMWKTFTWFSEEVGELARALLREDKTSQEKEFADCFAWLATLASQAGVDLEEAVRKYENGCPRCRQTPCACPFVR
ncbi:MAG: nucleotide pyrophosphohydrolase [Planctomycetes bacterium]|nr:nucleotide pyrophosphohydrolase [Planctomycetota bacterium]